MTKFASFRMCSCGTPLRLGFLFDVRLLLVRFATVSFAHVGKKKKKKRNDFS